MNKRPHGSGSVRVRGGTWYGRWYLGDQQIQRALGRVRQPGTKQGLTRSQAEAAMRKLISEVRYIAPTERLSFEEVAHRYIDHLENVMQRRPSTIQDYRIIARRHLGPHFGEVAIQKLGPDDITRYLAAKKRAGYSPKTVSNHLNFAHGVFRFALKRGIVGTNPVAATDRPRMLTADPDIRFLDREELEALLRAVPEDDALGPTDRALYLTAATTGLRQGELAALRWRDVDWSAGVVRVRRNYTRGEWGTPKSRRSSRAVPLPDRTAAELDRHHKRSHYRADDDLVFCHPHSGNPYDASKVRKRFYAAMDAAGMRERCGHEGGITFHSLRHTFGTRMAAVGVPMRTLQEWMGHRDFTTTLVYADYSPDPAQGKAFAERAFGDAQAESVGASGESEAPGVGGGEGLLGPVVSFDRFVP